MNIVSFVFGIVAAVTVAFIALIVVIVVMTFRNKKDLRIRIQEEIHVREHLFNSVEKLRGDLDEKYREAIAYVDRRVDRAINQLSK